MKFHKEAVSIHLVHQGTLGLNCNTINCNECATLRDRKKYEEVGHFRHPVSKDEGLRNTQGSNMWRGESDRGDRERDYVEVFLELMDESDYFDPFQKNALLKFGIAYEYQAKTLYQASFRAA